MAMAKDTDVAIKGDSLQGHTILFAVTGGIAAVESVRILFAVTGGIAAVESVRLARELRRHGANLTIMMTREAEKIITPLALSWASGTEVMTTWDYEMSQLEKHDAVLVAPATRNTISKHIHGIMDSPLF